MLVFLLMSEHSTSKCSYMLILRTYETSDTFVASTRFSLSINKENITYTDHAIKIGSITCLN